MKACCGFGHRTVLSNIKEDLYSAILKSIEEGCDTFYTGAMGEFDNMFSSAVRKAKKQFPDIKLICVKPYFTNDLNTNKEYYDTMYDDVIIPPAVIGVHYKAAITARNRWIVNNSNIVISYVIRNYGVAANVVKYAKQINKQIIALSE